MVLQRLAVGAIGNCTEHLGVNAGKAVLHRDGELSGVQQSMVSSTQQHHLIDVGETAIAPLEEVVCLDSF